MFASSVFFLRNGDTPQTGKHLKLRNIPDLMCSHHVFSLHQLYQILLPKDMILKKGKEPFFYGEWGHTSIRDLLWGRGMSPGYSLVLRNVPNCTGYSATAKNKQYIGYWGCACCETVRAPFPTEKVEADAHWAPRFLLCLHHADQRIGLGDVMPTYCISCEP